MIAGYGYGIRGYVPLRGRAGPAEGRKRVAYDVEPRPLPLVPTPLVKDGRLFLWSDDGVSSCLNVATGELIWCERVGGPFYGSPVWVD